MRDKSFFKGMKKTAAGAVFFFLLVLGSFVPATTVMAADLDEIEEYEIEVEPDFTDGSMYLTYHLKWRVLDSDSEGPLEWVKIGIPNENVEEITALSDNIDEIGYMSGSGTYVRIDFDRAYYAGELVDFSFSTHQHRLYELNQSSMQRTYSFTPGWFDECKVDQIVIKWSDEAVLQLMPAAEHNLLNEQYVITSSLDKGERLKVTAIYNDYSFEGQDNTTIDHSVDSELIIAIFLVIIPIILIIVLIVRRKHLSKNDYYTSHSGMGAVHYHNTTHRSGGYGGGGCACACACACAGGGRAGCSKKDFYGIKIESIRKNISV